MREYLPLIIPCAIIGVFTLVFLCAYAVLKKKTAKETSERHMPDSEIIRRLLRYAAPYKKEFALIFFIMLVSIAYDVVSPLLVATIQGTIKQSFQLSRLFTLVAVYAGILAVSMVCTYFQAMILQKIGQKILTQLRMDTFTHIEQLSHAQLNQIPVGKLVTRVTNDPNSISYLFTNILVTLVKNTLVILGVLGAMLILNYALTLMVLCFVPFLVLFTIIFQKFSRHVHRSVNNARTDVNTYLSENLSGMKVTQIFNQESRKLTEFLDRSQKLEKAKNVATEALQTAENANKAKTDFLSNMSHDIRTPMNAIIGITSLIRHDAGNKAKVIEYADKIDISSQHLLGIINDVLDMSKIEAGKTVFKYSDFSILDFMQELDTIFHSQIYEKQQTFTIIKENIQHEWVNGDQVHLMQIFSNLLSNAVKYTQEGGEIQFFVEECETKSSVYAKYRFLVSDNGMGMSADFKDTIFDAFTRAESSLTNKIQGTGLGMAITKNLVEAMGGTIDVESELGQGSCFEVLLDLKIAEDRTVALAAQEETDEQDGNILQGMRFLCAEDNELNAEILTELLKIEGAECTICENGEEILKAFEQSAPGDYDMILMDVQMPVMNGYEATKAIRRSSHELAKTIPIIAMTANAFSEDIQHSLAAGMNAHVSKPVEMKVLEKTIRNIKSSGGTEPQVTEQ